MKIALHKALIFFSFLPFFLGGCGGEAAKEIGQNDVNIYWVVSGGRCVDAGIYNVDIELIDADGVLYEQNRFLCANGVALFGDVPAGIYTVHIRGLDVANNEIYEAEPALVRVEEDPEPVQLLPPAELEVIRAAFEINWVFASGQICSFEGVEQIDVAVWDQIIAQKVVGLRVDCDFDPKTQNPLAEGESPEGLVIDGLVPRPSRIELFGLDEQGQRIFFGSVGPFELEPGEVKTAKVTLAPCVGDIGGGCR